MKIYNYFLLLFFLFQATNVLGYTKEEVLRRGFLNCGVSHNAPGFSFRNEDGRWKGFNVDICQAVAVAVLGSSERVKFVPLEVKGSYTALLSGKVDLLLLHERGSEWDFTRDSALAASFVGASFYDELGLMIAAPLKGKAIGDVKKVRSCLPENGRLFLTSYLRQQKVEDKPVIFTTEHQATMGFLKGECDLLAAPRSLLRSFERDGAGVMLPKKFGRLIFGPVVRQGDDNWFDIVRWTLFAMLDAEELSLSSSNIEEMRLNASPAIRRFFGYEGSGGRSLGLADDWAAQVITQVGNYQEIFAGNLGGPDTLGIERGKNNLYDNGGLHCPPPLK